MSEGDPPKVKFILEDRAGNVIHTTSFEFTHNPPWPLVVGKDDRLYDLRSFDGSVAYYTVR